MFDSFPHFLITAALVFVLMCVRFLLIRPYREKRYRSLHVPGTLRSKAGLFCPDCGAPMVVRRPARGGRFYGCTRFPICRGKLSARDFKKHAAESERVTSVGEQSP